METAFGSFNLTGEAAAAGPGDFSSGDPLNGGGFTTVTPFGNFSLGNDRNEAIQMQPFIPPAAQQQGMAWWESLIAYGATRAIDNRFGPVPVSGNVQAGSFAGQNGRTYVNTAGTGGTAPKAQAAAQQGPGLLALAAAAAFAFL